MMLRATLVLAAALLLGGVPQAKAGMITWGSIANATGNANDVVTSGTVVSSYTAYSSNLTLNGVTFDSPSNSTISLSSAAGGISSLFSYAPVGWNSTYRQLLNQGYQGGESGVTIALTGLTPGQLYEVQIWTPFWDHNWQTEFDGVSAAGNDSSGFLNLGQSYSNDPVSQYVTGTFTASGTTETIYAIGQNVSGTYLPTVAALDVQAVSVAAPAPSSLVLFGAATITLGGYGWRRQRLALHKPPI
jgi:hypothetical protein